MNMSARKKVDLGQHLRGKACSYKILEQLHHDVWIAM